MTVPCVRELVITTVCVVEALVMMDRESVVDIVALSDEDRLSDLLRRVGVTCQEEHGRHVADVGSCGSD